VVIPEGIGKQHGTVDQWVNIFTLKIVADHSGFVAALGQLPVEADEVVVSRFAGGEAGEKGMFLLQQVIEEVGSCVFPSEIDKTAG